MSDCVVVNTLCYYLATIPTSPDVDKLPVLFRSIVHWFSNFPMHQNHLEGF